MGGDSAEKVVSLKSGAVVAKHLDRSLYVPYPIMIDGKSWTYDHNGEKVEVNKNDFSLEIEGDKINFDGVFVAIHGTPGEDGKLQGYLDLLKIPYSTAGQLPLALTFDKAKCNALLKQYGVVSAKTLIFRKGEHWDADKIVEELGLPVFVKPNQAGSSFGVSKVKAKEELAKAIDEAFRHDAQVNIDEFIEGTEVTCGVHNLFGEIETLPITEIVAEGEFFDYTAKYEGKSQEITPARISDEEALKVSQITQEVFYLLNLDGVSRVDFIIKKGQPYLIEVNTVPGLSEASLIPQQAAEIGMDLKTLFNAWVGHMLK